MELVPADSWDALEDDERVRLHATLDASEDDVVEGRLISADEAIAKLRQNGS